MPALQIRHELCVRSPQFFFADQLAGLDRLIQEVHVLALYYHWSESDILRLPRPKRQRYLALLERWLSREPTRGIEV